MPVPLRVLQGRLGHARAAVLTIIEEEFDAAQLELRAFQEIGQTSTYTCSGVDPASKKFPFVLRRASSRSELPAMEAARDLLINFRPEVLLLLGIGGGIQRPAVRRNRIAWVGPEVGDVIVANYIHYAEYTKNLPSGHYMRFYPIDHPCKSLVEAHAQAAVFRPDGQPPWYDGLAVSRPGSGTPQFHQGELVALESIAGDPSSERQAEFLIRFDNALVVDMESMGVARAVHAARDVVHYNPTWMTIRGVSDAVRSEAELQLLMDANPTRRPPVDRRSNNDERERWKAYAAAIASRYAALIINRLLEQARPPIPADPGAPAYQFPLSVVHE